MGNSRRRDKIRRLNKGTCTGGDSLSSAPATSTQYLKKKKGKLNGSRSISSKAKEHQPSLLIPGILSADLKTSAVADS